MAVFLDILDLIRHKGGFGIAKTPNFCAKRHGSTCSTSLNKRRYWMTSTLVRPYGLSVCVAYIILFMKDISNVKVHLMTSSRNVNIGLYRYVETVHDSKGYTSDSLDLTHM